MNVNLNNVKPYLLSKRITSDKMITLDWNESPFEPIPVIQYFEKHKFTKLNSYPDPSNSDLKKEISRYTNVDESYIETFNGSDSALDYTFRVLVNHGDQVLIPTPNYTQINQTIVSLGGEIIYCTIEELTNQIKVKQPKIVYLSNPNNPLGYNIEVLSMILENTNIYFVIDEAYFEFSNNFSVFDKAQNIENLIVTRTFSKALCLAALRLGYLTSNQNILKKIRSIKNFKEVNKLAEIAGVVTLKNIDWYNKSIDEINRIKVNFAKNLKNVKIFNSSANFILIQSDKYCEILEELQKENILVRDRSAYVDNTLRISIGKENDMSNVSQIINKITK
jgi:histidinol-phosphate aminotransferase